jgi:hypothetical protein
LATTIMPTDFGSVIALPHSSSFWLIGLNFKRNPFHLLLWAGELADGSESVQGLRKLRPPCRLATLARV